jgi:hypothetical protein
MENNQLNDTVDLVDRKPNEAGFSYAELLDKTGLGQAKQYDPSMALHSELHGTQVLVHPYLENDPTEKQGKVGVIAYARTFDEISVAFMDGKEGVYALDNIMQLKKREVIFPDDKAAMKNVSIKDYKDLFTIARLQEMGRSTDIMRALDIAGKNPAIWDRTLSPVSESMARKNEYSIGR